MGQKFQSYPGTRDFYPQEMEKRNWMFSIQRRACLQYGYEEYGAPILESTDLYRAKSSDEIVNDQLYRFVDRGEREVAIRPEMTPTLARMVVARLPQMILPLRLFSIANFMRYERPGRGRLREFYQLNVDLFGGEQLLADAEVLALAGRIMASYGASAEHYTIRINNRELFDAWFRECFVDKKVLGRLLDKREKIGHEAFLLELEKEKASPADLMRVEEYLELNTESLKDTGLKGADDLALLLDFLAGQGLDSIQFDPAIIRGFDYYTGLIFEVNDLHADNRRALFGGGRYDGLIEQLGGPALSAIGFGMGDVTLDHFLELHGLYPGQAPRDGYYFANIDAALIKENFQITEKLRHTVPVEMGVFHKKFGKQLENAEKKGYRFVLIRGSGEKEQGILAVKDLSSGAQEEIKLERASEELRNRLLQC